MAIQVGLSASHLMRALAEAKKVIKRICGFYGKAHVVASFREGFSGKGMQTMDGTGAILAGEKSSQRADLARVNELRKRLDQVLSEAANVEVECQKECLTRPQERNTYHFITNADRQHPA
ncbi:MAG: hypothetical protein ABSG53_08735 [Thermoguttaceae bacterium]